METIIEVKDVTMRFRMANDHINSIKEYAIARIKEANIPYRGEHVFRHTYTTNHYKKKTNIKILSKVLGHSSVAITQDIYVHLYGDGFDEMYAELVRNEQ